MDSKRGDATSDYRERLMIGLVQGVLSGDVTHQQLMDMRRGPQRDTSTPLHWHHNTEMMHSYQNANHTNGHINGDGMKNDSIMKDLKEILLLKLGISETDIERVFSNKINTIIEYNNINIKKTKQVQQEKVSSKRDPGSFVNPRLPAINSEVTSLNSIIHNNSSLLYQMIKDIENRNEFSTRPSNDEDVGMTEQTEIIPIHDGKIITEEINIIENTMIPITLEMTTESINGEDVTPNIQEAASQEEIQPSVCVLQVRNFHILYIWLLISMTNKLNTCYYWYELKTIVNIR